MIKLELKKNLRREILRGHQWLYHESFEVVSGNKKSSGELALLKDGKEELAWGIFDSKSPIGFRVLHIGKNMRSVNSKFERAFRLRDQINKEQTTAYRLFNGEGDGLPGIVCDVYSRVAILQFDGEGPEAFWRKQKVEDWILEFVESVESVYFKPRKSLDLEHLSGRKLEDFEVKFKENGVIFSSDLKKSQKTGFFLDQRDNREYVRFISKNKSVVNLFSYTGGFSVYAGLGGALKVESIDISKGAVQNANKNWLLNNLDPDQHAAIAEDVFKYIDEIKTNKDLIIVDPPSMTSSKDSKKIAMKKYVDLFARVATKVKKEGDLILSSCSSQISFDDFDQIIKDSLSKAKRRGQVVRVSGQGIDHPYPHNQSELRYLKFVHLVLD